MQTQRPPPSAPHPLLAGASHPWISLISLLFVISAAPLCWSLLAWSLFPDQPYGRAWTMGAIIPLDTEQLSLWRLLIAPLLHEDGAHLLINLSLSALFLLPLSTPTPALRGPTACWGELFLVTQLGALFAFLPRALLPLGDDWSLGLSGGVYALAGLLSAQLHSPRARFTLSLLFALQGGLGASVDRVAHWTGLGLGLCWGSLRLKWLPASRPWRTVSVLYAGLWVPAILACWSSFHQLDLSQRSGRADAQCLNRVGDGRLIRCLLRDGEEGQMLAGVEWSTDQSLKTALRCEQGMIELPPQRLWRCENPQGERILIARLGSALPLDNERLASLAMIPLAKAQSPARRAQPPARE